MKFSKALKLLKSALAPWGRRAPTPAPAPSLPPPPPPTVAPTPAPTSAPVARWLPPAPSVTFRPAAPRLEYLIARLQLFRMVRDRSHVLCGPTPAALKNLMPHPLVAYFGPSWVFVRFDDAGDLDDAFTIAATEMMHGPLRPRMRETFFFSDLMHAAWTILMPSEDGTLPGCVTATVGTGHMGTVTTLEDVLAARRKKKQKEEA